MDKITTKSTSKVTASANDITLRDKPSVRLIFRPTFVDNPKDKNAAVSGVFLYQRKGKDDEWVDYETISLASVKKGEGYKLDLSTSETLRLFQELTTLYTLYEQEGLPRGRQEYVRLDGQLRELIDLPVDQLSSMLDANSEMGGEFVTRLLRWALSEQDPVQLVKRLSETAPDSLRILNTSASVERLKEAVRIWSENRLSTDEEFWQKTIAENSFVLEQVYSWPVTIVEEKAFVGGKEVSNKGGGLVDFLVANQLTNNAALIEIKTPATKLLRDTEYRNGVFNVSEELSGAIMQVLNYKATLLRKYDSLESAELFEAFDPKCMVIVGHYSNEIKASKAKRKSFEIYRSQFPDVEIITYDELVRKTQSLIRVLENMD